MFTYIWLIFMVDVGTCTIHGSCGYDTNDCNSYTQVKIILGSFPQESWTKQSRSACSLVPHVLQLQYFTKLRKYGNRENLPFKATFWHEAMWFRFNFGRCWTAVQWYWQDYFNEVFEQRCLHCNWWLSSWWFQPIWKISVKLDHFPR